MSWPKEYGGRGATLIEQAIFNEEMVRAQAPQVANVLGLAMGGPTVIAHGTEEQRRRYLPPILSAEEIWCQGFSEPDSGSDLASLKTRAVRDGDEWVVTGQKVWTTFAHHAKWCMLVARTDPDAPKHKGLTYFLMDMEQDAVQVRPLRQITGEAEFNELFIEEARIPHENIVGGEGNGWAVAITTLMHERATLAFGLQVARPDRARRADARRRARRAVNGRVGERGSGDPPAPGAAADRGRGAAAERLPRPQRDMRNGVPGPEGSLGKWHWSEVNQSLTELAMDIAGPHAMLERGRLDLPLPARARQLDRGRHDRDPQEHRRRARARAAPTDAMNFDFTDDQQAIKRTARDFLAARYQLEAVRELAEDERGFTDEQWRELAELGWPGVMVPEADGGLGLGAVELVVIAGGAGIRARAEPAVLERLRGAACSSPPARDEQRERWLAPLASGEARGTLAVWDEQRRLGAGSLRARGRGRARSPRRRSPCPMPAAPTS